MFFRCPGIQEFVQVESLLQEGEPMAVTKLEYYRDLVRNECYSQSVTSVASGVKVRDLNVYHEKRIDDNCNILRIY